MDKLNEVFSRVADDWEVVSLALSCHPLLWIPLLVCLWAFIERAEAIAVYLWSIVARWRKGRARKAS